MLEQCDVQIDKMQGAAKGGYPMQATPNGVVEDRGPRKTSCFLGLVVTGQRSRLAISTSSVQHYMLRTTHFRGDCKTPRNQKIALLAEISSGDPGLNDVVHP